MRRGDASRRVWPEVRPRRHGPRQADRRRGMSLLNGPGTSWASSTTAISAGSRHFSLSSNHSAHERPIMLVLAGSVEVPYPLGRVGWTRLGSDDVPIAEDRVGEAVSRPHVGRRHESQGLWGDSCSAGERLWSGDAGSRSADCCVRLSGVELPCVAILLSAPLVTTTVRAAPRSPPSANLRIAKTPRLSLTQISTRRPQHPRGLARRPKARRRLFRTTAY